MRFAVERGEVVGYGGRILTKNIRLSISPDLCGDRKKK